jgi:predicted ATPase
LDVEPGPATQAAYEQLLKLEAPAVGVALPLEMQAPTDAASTVAPRAYQLPAPATPFIGREAELAHLAELLADPDCRLLTIVGPGGIGKTRLALETAAGHVPVFRHGAAFVSLSPISAVDRIAATVAAALQLPLSDSATHEAQLITFLQDKELLLVLDNLEHLLDGDKLLATILTQTASLKLLITSRQRLEIPGEWSFDLSGFPLPDEQTPLAENSAVAFFVQTAQRLERTFTLTDQNRPAVIRICQLVGGMPLGLQLAATWVRVLSCAEIAQEIESDLDFLSSSQRYLPERQRSIRAVLDYSWQLLRPSEQQACCRLTLFRGGFTRDAAQAVAGASLPILSSLVDKALINRMSDGRYDMHELVRQYARSLLEAKPAAQVAAPKAHAVYFQALAEEARSHLQGAESLQWLARLDAEINNLRAALSWSLEYLETGIGLQLAGALWRYWWWRGHWREGLDWLEQLLAQNEARPADQAAPNITVAGAYQGAGVLARNLGDYAGAHRFYEQSLALQRREGNLNGIAAALMSMANLSMFEADYTQAEALLEETITLYRKTGNSQGLRGALNNKGIVAMYQEDYAQARLLQEENVAFARLEENPAHIGAALGNLGEVLRYLGEYEQARQALNESLLLLQNLNNKQALATTTYDLGRLALDMADLPAASTYFQQCLSLHLEVRDPVAVADVLEGVAIWAGRQSRPSACAQMFGAAAALRQTTGTAVPQPERALHQQIQTEMITAVGEAAFQDMWQKGQALSLEAALMAARTILA